MSSLYSYMDKLEFPNIRADGTSQYLRLLVNINISENQLIQLNTYELTG